MGTIDHLSGQPKTPFPLRMSFAGLAPYVPSAMPAVPAVTGPADQFIPQAQPMLVEVFRSPENYAVSRYRYPNGFEVFIEDRPSDLVSSRIYVGRTRGTGSIFEDPVHPSPLYDRTGFPSGIAHLDEHCHFLTLRRHPVKNSWTEAVSRLGANFNASTEGEVIQHEITSNAPRFAEALQLQLESLDAVYNDKDINQEKTNVINERNQRMSDPGAKALNKLYELAFDRPIMDQTLGTVDDVLKTTADDLRRFKQAFYTPDNLASIISGRVNHQDVLQKVSRTIGSMPGQAPIAYGNAMRIALRPGEIRHATVEDPKLTYSIVNLGFPAPPKSSLRERAAMEYLGMLLGDGPLSILENSLLSGINPKTQQAYATQVSLDYSPMKQAGLFTVSLQTGAGRDQEKDALAVTLNRIAQLSHPTGFDQVMTPQRFQDIHNKLVYKFQRQFNDAEWATHTMGEELVHGSLPYYTQYLQLIAGIQPHEIHAVARKYLRPDTYAVAYAVPPAQAVPTLPAPPMMHPGFPLYPWVPTPPLPINPYAGMMPSTTFPLATANISGGGPR